MPRRRFSSLTALEDLHFGTVPRVTGKGLLEGLEPLTRLTSLTLVIPQHLRGHTTCTHPNTLIP